MFDFGMRIKELRKQHKMSQAELGKRVNRSKSVISSYENNLKVPSVDILTNMAVIFNVSLDYLVGIDKNEMISVEKLTDCQKKIIHTILVEFEDGTSFLGGLTERQQEILNMLMKEFSRKKQ